MFNLQTRLAGSPVLVRAAPFLVFVILTAGQPWFGEAGRFWIYLLKTLVGGAMLWLARRHIPELKWTWSWEAVSVGFTVFVLWVALDPYYPKLGVALPWNPHAVFGADSAIAWFFVAVRFVGAILLVPMLEEVFFRSLVYRIFVRPDFENAPLGVFRVIPFVATAVCFGAEHREWLAGIVCGLAYQGLVCRRGRLGDAITAHAVTNLLLGIWVVTKGAWNFW